jgi:ferredoxin
MKLYFLKHLRVVISLLFFVAIFLIFVDFRETIPNSWINATLYLQFLPSLLKFISTLALASAGFLIIILITALFGRVYCSSICPLGTLQDIFTWIHKKVSPLKIKKRFFRFSLPHNFWRYGILTLCVVSFLFGSIFLINLLDPYSNFGRFSSNFAQPVVVYANNTLVGWLEKMNYYWLFTAKLRGFYLTSFIFPVIMITIIFWLSWKHGRLYCNTLCPVGTLLGLVSKYSMFKLAINTEDCNNCNSCVYSCKATCIDRKKKEIDFSRCIACFNCIKACDENAIYFRNDWFGRPKAVMAIAGEEAAGPQVSKRSFLGMLAAGSLAMMGFKQNEGSKSTPPINSNVVPTLPTTVPVEPDYPVAPPGAGSIDHFNNYCTACTLCVKACPNHVLQPSFLQYGFKGMMQPHMDYDSGFCNYDCVICAEICPTGALLKFSDIDHKHTTQIGKAKFIKENCVVETEGTDCGACSEHCPTKAVDMVPYGDTGLFIPEIDEDICIGCGACVYPCPTRPYKAIYVDGNPEHLLVDKPEILELEDDQLPADDFPF